MTTTDLDLHTFHVQYHCQLPLADEDVCRDRYRLAYEHGISVSDQLSPGNLAGLAKLNWTQKLDIDGELAAALLDRILRLIHR